VDRRRLLAGDQIPPGSRFSIAAVGVMVGDQPGVLVHPVRGLGHLLEPASGEAVVVAPMAAKHPFVGDVTQQGVLEQELPAAVERRFLALVHDLPSAQAVERLGGRALRLGQRLVAVEAQGLDGVVPEHAADHRSALQRQALGDRQRFEAGLQHAAQGGRDLGVLEALVEHLPDVGFGGDHVGLDEPVDQLLDVERVALRRHHDQVAERLGDVVGTLEDLVEQPPRVAPRQRTQGQQRVEVEALAPVGMRFEQRRARRRDHEDRTVAQHRVSGVDQRQRRLVGPVQILEQQHDRALGGEGTEVVGEVARRPSAEVLRIVAESVEHAALADLEPEPCPDDVRLVDRLWVGSECLLDPPLPLAPDLVGAVAVVDVEAGSEEIVEQRVRQSSPGMGGAAAEPPHLLGDLVEPAVEVGEQS
jgi:hypothetical protein